MLLQLLRSETRSQHEALEALFPLGKPGLSQTLYVAVLRGFYSFYATWERQALEQAGARLRSFAAGRVKLPLLAADLRAFGTDPAAVVPMDPAWLPCLDQSDALLLGSMYVVEGATLGGQVISRGLERDFGFRDGYGYSFFLSYGREAVAQRWRAFTALLEHIPPSEHTDVGRAAQGTFDAFGRSLAVCLAQASTVDMSVTSGTLGLTPDRTKVTPHT